MVSGTGRSGSDFFGFRRTSISVRISRGEHGVHKAQRGFVLAVPTRDAISLSIQHLIHPYHPVLRRVTRMLSGTIRLRDMDRCPGLWVARNGIDGTI